LVAEADGNADSPEMSMSVMEESRTENSDHEGVNLDLLQKALTKGGGNWPGELEASSSSPTQHISAGGNLAYDPMLDYVSGGFHGWQEVESSGDGGQEQNLSSSFDSCFQFGGLFNSGLAEHDSSSSSFDGYL
jgi:hypothetical protein